MALLRTLTCTPSMVERQAMTFTSEVDFDNGFSHVFDRTQRPLYMFQLDIGPLVRAEVESLSAFHSFHKGGRSFLWDGNAWGSVKNYNLIGEGDGAKTQFFLPNRYIGAGSLAIRTVLQTTAVTSNWATSSANSWPYSLNATPGLIVFANSANTIVQSGHDLYAAWGNQYRCRFDPAGIVITNFAPGVFQAKIKLIEVSLVN